MTAPHVYVDEPDIPEGMTCTQFREGRAAREAAERPRRRCRPGLGWLDALRRFRADDR